MSCILLVFFDFYGDAADAFGRHLFPEAAFGWLGIDVIPDLDQMGRAPESVFGFVIVNATETVRMDL